MPATIALIGLGEVGRILAEDLMKESASVAAWDLKFADPESPPSKSAASLPIRKASSGADAVRGAQVVISAVTAAQDVEAAKAAAPGLAAGAFFVDFNSASPGMKRESAAIVEAEGGRYVEGAVMSPFPPKRLASPILLGGPHAEGFLAVAHDLGFTGMSVFAPEVGKASAAKMCRSVMIKGIEALLSESLLSARYYGVEDTVLASLQDLFPGPEWPKLSHYMITRTLEHGVRRAEEMWEVARTVKEAGVSPLMSRACAERQAWAPQFRSALAYADLKHMLDSVRAQMAEKVSPRAGAGAGAMSRVKFAPLPVADIDRALAFYTGKLGLKAVVDDVQDDGERWVELKVGTSVTRIVFTRSSGPLENEPALVLVTDDVDAAAARLAAAGVELAQPPADAPWAEGERYAVLRDSEGNLVMLGSG